MQALNTVNFMLISRVDVAMFTGVAGGARLVQGVY